MSFIDLFKCKKWGKLGQPIDTETLYTEIRLSYAPTDIYLRDRDYRAIPLSDFMQLMADYRQDEPHYANQIFDCDDFSVCFVADLRRAWADVSRGYEALAFGFVDGQNMDGDAHVWVWHRDDQGVYTWIEPQMNRCMVGTPRSFKTFEG